MGLPWRNFRANEMARTPKMTSITHVGPAAQRILRSKVFVLVAAAVQRPSASGLDDLELEI